LLSQLAGLFAIECGGFSLIDNHLHCSLRIDPQMARSWPAEEVARRWL
jgi:hypothetical protein